MWEKRNAYRILVRKSKGKRPLGRPRHKSDDIKMDLREIGWDGKDLNQDRDQYRVFVNTVINLQVI
jgi:hypothetical protein